jgi:chromosome segregation ATPase
VAAASNALSEAHKDRLQLRDSVTRLAIGVESISGDLQNIRGEIRNQVSELKVEIHEQVSGLKAELHQQQINHDQRMSGIEYRVDGVNQRIDALAASDGILLNRVERNTDRLAWERGCPPRHPDEDGKP